MKQRLYAGTGGRFPEICLGQITHATRQRRSLAIFGVAVVLLTLPSSTTAKPGYKVHPGGMELILPVEQRGNRIISVSANDRQRVKLEVEGSSGTIEVSTNGHVSSQRIEADFGALGRIDLDLQLAHLGSEPSRVGRCKGRGPLHRVGTYRGTIEFVRQSGVPEISAKRGRVHFERLFRQVCKRRLPAFKPGPFPNLKRKIEEGSLTVRGKGEGRTIHLSATIFAFKRNPVQSGGALSVMVYEQREGVRIARRTGGFFERDSLVMSKRGERPETIEVGLPKPFAGRALYSRDPGSASRWTGDLTVNLPGAYEIPLTGAAFTAVLCRGRVDSCLYRNGSNPQSLPD